MRPPRHRPGTSAQQRLAVRAGSRGALFRLTKYRRDDQCVALDGWACWAAGPRAPRAGRSGSKVLPAVSQAIRHHRKSSPKQKTQAEAFIMSQTRAVSRRLSEPFWKDRGSGDVALELGLGVRSQMAELTFSESKES